MTSNLSDSPGLSGELLARMRSDISFLLACLEMCDEAEAPPSELDALDRAMLADIRRDYPHRHAALTKATDTGRSS